MMNPLETNHLQLILTAQCPKLSPTAEGLLSYNIWQKIDNDVLYLALAANEGGGYFSHELIPVLHIMDCLTALQASNLAFPAIRLRTAFEGKSANNASFLAAVLRHQQVLLPSPENTKLHIVDINISTWPERLLQRNTRFNSPTNTDNHPQPNATPPIKAAKGKQKTAPNASPEPIPSPVTNDMAGTNEDESLLEITDENYS
jgi:hypothetical protein